MRITRTKLVVFMVMAAALFITVCPVCVMAGGEPGGGCGLTGLKYDPAPYIGDIVLTWVQNGNTGDVYAQGIVEQAGNSGCTGTFSGVIIDDVPLDIFQAWRGNDLRLTCLENLCDYSTGELICPFPCHGDGEFFEVVGVGAMKELTDYSFTAKFVIMHLE